MQAAEATDPFGVVGATMDIYNLALEVSGVALDQYEPLPLTARP